MRRGALKHIGSELSLPAWLLLTITLLLKGLKVLAIHRSRQSIDLVSKRHYLVSKRHIFVFLISSGNLHLGVETGRGPKHKRCVCLSPDWVYPCAVSARDERRRTAPLLWEESPCPTTPGLQEAWKIPRRRSLLTSTCQAWRRLRLPLTSHQQCFIGINLEV